MAAAADTTLRQRLSFDANVPQIVTVLAKGTEQANSRDGSPEWRYFLADHKIMWIPESAHLAMLNAHAPLPATFELTKVKRGKDAATWDVVHIADEPAAAAEEAKLVSQPAPPAAPAKGSQQPAAPAAPPAPRPAPTAATPTPATDPNAAYFAAFRTALRCASLARKSGQPEPLILTAADLLTIAATIYQDGGK
jgi:hypothetical protein